MRYVVFALNAVLQDPFERQRERKLARYPRRIEDLIVEVRDPRNLSDSEAAEIRRLCAVANMAVYASPLADLADKDLARRLGERLGLARLQANPLADDDGISSLEVAPEKSARGYLPYSNRRLLWHTDGYYNALDRRILGMTLHCAQDAESGGENALLDHEIAYIQLRDANPDYVAALMRPDAMTIPARMDEDNVARPEQSGPVFAVDPEQGFLTMRYTARTRSIVWKDDAATRAAVKTLADILAGSEYILTARLAPGMGLVCNNVLHTRSAFSDSPEHRRLLYRGRYYDRLNFTARAA